MPISVCPAANVTAPADVVWSVLTDPESYGEWWDARTDAIDPPGSATPGQVIRASTHTLGRNWPVVVWVVGVDAARRVIDLETSLPFGISVRNHIICSSVDASSSLITFG